MTESAVSAPLVWRVIGTSVRGASHVRSNSPNQDALQWLPESGDGPPVILAVADGHGSQKHTQSDRGARFAVEIAIAQLQDFLRRNQGNEIRQVRSDAQERLPRDLERAWKQRVDEDIRGNLSATAETDPKRFLAYGSTLLVVAITDAFLLYLQLGDGDILGVSHTGAVAHLLPRDERLFANETTSLCLPRAYDHFRIRCEAISNMPPDQLPALILVTTDGYANSFQEQAGFLKTGQDYLAAITANGLETVSGWLAGWLTETSQQGSGDDITLGIISRLPDPDHQVGSSFSAAELMQ
jgi:serine/threonine protein phosphatase PrpC